MPVTPAGAGVIGPELAGFLTSMPGFFGGVGDPEPGAVCPALAGLLASTPVFLVGVGLAGAVPVPAAGGFVGDEVVVVVPVAAVPVPATGCFAGPAAFVTLPGFCSPPATAAGLILAGVGVGEGLGDTVGVGEGLAAGVAGTVAPVVVAPVLAAPVATPPGAVPPGILGAFASCLGTLGSLCARMSAARMGAGPAVTVDASSAIFVTTMTSSSRLRSAAGLILMTRKGSLSRSTAELMTVPTEYPLG